MNRSEFLKSRPLRFASLLTLACASMAFTLPGCPDVEGMNAKMAEIEKKAADSQKQARDLTEQVRILNDEHNTMKQLVSQISTTVLEQKDSLEKLDAAIHRAPPAAAASAKRPVPKKRR
ncbi:MAG: hypothetical protein H7301_13185 [Cryobacterium sp.]|nr:hypothetical protein [Oligoflexia bacterium]